jgi:hypothetical protein
MEGSILDDVIDGRFDLGGMVAIGKGLAEGPILPIVNGYFASVPRCAVFVLGAKGRTRSGGANRGERGEHQKVDVSRRSAKRS